MIVDSSALISVIFNEADEDRFLGAMVDAPLVRMSAANWLEAAIVVDARRDPDVEVRFDEVIRTLGIQIAPVTEGIALRARRAYVQFGRGNHPARLNYGDCFAYALAKVEREPLLFKGNDFAQTDIEPALKP
jgi:ribonuclease VapC